MPVPTIVVRVRLSPLPASLTVRSVCPHLPAASLTTAAARKVQRALDKRLADPKRGTYASLIDPNKADLSIRHTETIQPSAFAQARGRRDENGNAPTRRTRSSDRDDRPRHLALRHEGLKPKLSVNATARPSTSHV